MNKLQSIVFTAEVEELAGRLKASRQRVTDLEKNLSTSNSANQKLDKSNKELTKDLEKLKMETYKNKWVTLLILLLLFAWPGAIVMCYWLWWWWCW